jgi:DNA (cytosine-5)-methyltransferase 1
VRAALLRSGRLKHNGVTRFDARVWHALVAGSSDLHLHLNLLLDGDRDGAIDEDGDEAAVAAGDPGSDEDDKRGAEGCADGAPQGEGTSEGIGGDEWAVHVFGLYEGQQEDDAMAALLASGNVRYIADVRIGSPACYVDTEDTRGRSSAASRPPVQMEGWTPLMSTEERERTMRERRVGEVQERGTGGLSAPRWAPGAHDALARAVTGAGAWARVVEAPSVPPSPPPFKPFTFSEMFAGVGGFGLALRSLGGTAVFASELCGHARRTYLVHHGAGDSDTGGAGVGAVAGYTGGGGMVDGGEIVDKATTPFDGGGAIAEEEPAAGVPPAAAAATATATAAAPLGMPLMMTGDITDVWEGIIPPHDILTGGFPCQSFSQRGDQLGLEDARGQLYKEILRVLTACQPKVRPWGLFVSVITI